MTNPSEKTDAEILLGCILVSGTLDTAIVLAAIQAQNHGLRMTDERRTAYAAFYRVWSAPSQAEREKVIEWAGKIAGKQRIFRWTLPA